MDFTQQYKNKVKLLLQILPLVAQEKCFALKGGTAINLFIRDLPRLSVDIDLTYLPLDSRHVAIDNIEKGLVNIKNSIIRTFRTIFIEEKFTNGVMSKILIGEGLDKIIIEPNLVLRGHVFPCQLLNLSKETEKIFNLTVGDMPTLSFADIYGGKICAALDRQHPRDLYDVKILYENEGITEQVRQAFVVYLASHPRPIFELLNPNILNNENIFLTEFKGMTQDIVAYDQLIAILHRLVHDLNKNLTENERKFLLSVKQGEPNWHLMPFSHLKDLPALQWKIENVRKIESNKHKKMLGNLKKILDINN